MTARMPVPAHSVASDDAALPVDAAQIVRRAVRMARAITIELARSLNELLGRRVSSFSQTARAPRRSCNRAAR